MQPVAAAFEDFFDKEFQRLFEAMLLKCGNRTEAEDIAQEAMVRVYERWDRIRGMENPTGYLYRVAFNLNRNRIRRAAAAIRGHIRVMPAQNPANRAETVSEAMLLLERLSAPQRDAVVLVGWLGLTAEEAGPILGISPVSVRGRIHRARTILSEALPHDERS